MFHLPKNKPDLPAFRHSSDCKILARDPSVEIHWSEIRGGVWEAVCVCGKQYHYVEVAARARQDPYDPDTFRHAGQCEQRDITDPALIRMMLRVKEGAGGTHWFVECGVCGNGWQVLHYLEPVAFGDR